MIPKFRAWHKEKKIMCSIGQIRFAVVHAKQELINKEVWVSVDLHKAWEKWLFSEIELMQWTGLWDEYNKEIFLGDILAIKNLTDFDHNPECWGKIVFEDLQYQIEFYGDHERQPLIDYANSKGVVYDSYIAGNIWENPELMEIK